MNISEIEIMFSKFNNLRVVVIGDVMLDSYIWGKVKRISPEAPVPVVSGLKREYRLGGAGNVALNIQSLGAKPILCGVIGTDDKSKIFCDLMKESQLDIKGIFNDETRPTTIKTRIISDNHHLLRIDDETTEAINSTIENEILCFIKDQIENKKTDVIIFEDYDKGLISVNIINEIVELATKKKIPILVDPKKRNFLNYKGVSLFKPNFKEFAEGNKQDLKKGDFKSMFVQSKIFMEKMNIKNMLITMAELGIFVCDGKNYTHVPVNGKIEITDVSGAGDTVISVVALCLACGMDLKDIAFIANYAGGLVCGKPGVVPITKNELLHKFLNS